MGDTDNLSMIFSVDADYDIYQKLYEWLGMVNKKQKEQEFDNIVVEFERKKALAIILKDCKDG